MNDIIKAAMPALLSDPDTKKAVVDYINALTDKERPEKEWRQVWWQLSDDVRRDKEDDRYSLRKNPEVRLYVTAEYSYRKIGLILAMFVPDGFDPNNRWSGVDPYHTSPVIHRETFTVDSFVDVVIQSQKAWELLHIKWVAATLPLSDDETR